MRLSSKRALQNAKSLTFEAGPMENSKSLLEGVSKRQLAGRPSVKFAFILLFLLPAFKIVMHFAHLPALRGVWKCGLQALQTHTSWPTTKSENTPTPNRSLNRHESQTNRFRSSIWEQVATASSGRYVTVYQLIALLGYKGWENRVMAGTSLEPLTPISSSGWQAPDWTGRFIEGHSNTSTGQTCSRYMQ